MKYHDFQHPPVCIWADATVADFDNDIKQYLAPQPRVLFIRDNGAGDVIMSVPAVRELKRRLPDAYITYATLPKHTGLLDGIECIDEVIDVGELDMRAGGYSLIVNWTRAVENYSIERNRRHRIDSFALQLGLGVLADRRTELHLSAADRRAAAEMLSGRGGRFVGYVMRAATWNRTWPLWRVPRLCAELARMMPDHCVVLIDAQSECGFEAPNVVDACGRTRTFKQAAALLEHCDAAITQDTGLAHACGALGVPAVALAGGIPPEVRFSTYPHFRCIHPATRVDCCPCWDWQERYVDGPRSGSRKSCRATAINVCLESISAAEIARETAELVQLLQQKQAGR